MPRGRVARRFAAAVKPPAGQTVGYQTGTVTTVTAGASTDGRAAVVVTIGGTAFPAPYLRDGYPTPAVNDVVAVLFVNGSPLILGRPAGFPAI